MKIRLFYALLVLLFCSSCHVGRFFVWNLADLNDSRRFASMPVERKGEPFRFAQRDSAVSPLALPKDIDGETWEQFLKDEGTVGFLIIRNDTILYERYFDGYDEEREVPTFSVAKSFVSALIGIAIKEGHIGSINDPITKYLPELKREGFEKITIAHLLLMRSGIRYNEGYYNPFGHVARYYYGRNLARYIRQLKIKEAPNQRFEYISVNTQLLGFIIERATGKKLADYLSEKIWQPLGMEYPASWSIDSRQHKNAKAFCCINARMRDYAKFGRLFLKKGEWQGQQIVPSAWVEQSTTPANNGLYSYQWWHVRSNSKPNFMAQGILGQYIYVQPDKNIIIVRLGKRDRIYWGAVFAKLAEAN